MALRKSGLKYFLIDQRVINEIFCFTFEIVVTVLSLRKYSTCQIFLNKNTFTERAHTTFSTSRLIIERN